MCTGDVSCECACVKAPARPAAREAAFKSLLRLRRFPQRRYTFPFSFFPSFLFFPPFFSFSSVMRFKDFLKMMLC